MTGRSGWIKLLAFVACFVIGWAVLSYPLYSQRQETTTSSPTNNDFEQQQQQDDDVVAATATQTEETEQPPQTNEEPQPNHPQRVVIENHFNMPVDLYWINMNVPQEQRPEYVLIDSNIAKFPTHYILGARRSDSFLLKDPQKDTIVFEFSVGSPDVDGGDVFVVAGSDGSEEIESMDEEIGEDEEGDDEEDDDEEDVHGEVDYEYREEGEL